MIQIYGDLPENLFIKANVYLASFIEFYFDDIDESDEYTYSSLFPIDIYRTRKEKCINVIHDLQAWPRDNFVHTLTPLHEHALYVILKTCDEINSDYAKYNNGKQLFFEMTMQEIEETRKMYEEMDLFDDNEWRIDDLQQFHFYFENCYQDHDFLDVPLFYSSFKIMSPKYFSQLRIELDDYVDLIPPDIETEYHNIKKEEKLEYYVDNKLIQDTNFQNVVKQALEGFSHSIVNHGSYKLLWNEKNSRDEKSIQNLFLVSSHLFFNTHNIDISREANIGRGPVDFKISRGNKEKILVEIKKAANPKINHGIKKQLPKYMIAEEVKVAYYLVVVFDKEEFEKINHLQQLIDEINNDYCLEINLIVIDATLDKPSASKLLKDYNIFD